MKELESAQIISLRAENVKRLKAVTIRPDGQTVVISGRNAQGKSSVLDAIEMALGGMARTPERPLRDGEEKGRIVVDLGDLVVTRTFTAAGGGSLTVAGKDGARYPSPQGILDALVGKLTFDPLEFRRMKPDARAATLKELAGVDFAALDARRVAAYTERTDVNRDLKAATARAAAAPRSDDAPAEEVSLAALADEARKGEEQNARNRTARARIDQAEKDRQLFVREEQMLAERCPKIEAKAARWMEETEAELQAQIKSLTEAARERIISVQKSRDQELVEIRRQQEAAFGKALALEAEIARTAAEVERMQDVDTAEIRQRIVDAERVNAAVRANAAAAKLEAEARALGQKAADLDKAVKACDQEKADLLKSARLPIEGLGISNTGVTFGDMPFEQCSGAEQIRISLAMACALNPKLKVCLIRNGNDLDRDSLAQVADMAQAQGIQVWIERIEGGLPGAVVIEDGAVQEGGAK